MALNPRGGALSTRRRARRGGGWRHAPIGTAAREAPVALAKRRRGHWAGATLPPP